jgi:DNA topoisomerase-1
VVVESPTKTKTLKKYLGPDFEIKASLGHIKDLPKSELGVDVEHNFAPQYEVAPKKKKVVSELKAAAKGAEEIYLATDPDREGEAIAQHVNEELRIKNKGNVKRVVFHEITADAVKEAFAHPRKIDDDLVDAQKARRVLDRLVGYKLSPLLWKKIRYGLSAGRVQSVAVRLIVEREREREAFKPEEFWRIEALLQKLETGRSKLERRLEAGGSKSSIQPQASSPASSLKHLDSSQFSALLIKKDDKKLKIQNKKQADSILKDLEKANYIVKEIKTEEKKRYPAPPFTTSTLQQNAFNTYGFSSKRTMRAAQALYEQGLITYHRTDSTNLAASAVSQIRKLIAKEFGEKYLTAGAKVYKTKAKVAQEAHEAIRPTNFGLQIQSAKFKVQSSLGRDGKKLYELIWKRAVACQMNPAIFDQQTVDVAAKNYLFRATGQVLKFDGFLKVYGVVAGLVPASSRATTRVAATDKPLPELSEGEKLDLVKLTPTQHFTQPPARYTEATLIKELEKNGIGRPSTYAPTISTIQERGYVSKEERALKPEDIGIVVNDLLVEHFPQIVDLQFTAEMEDDLDKIADGKRKWVPVIREFYGPFEKELRLKNKELRKEDFTTLEKTSEKCPECGKPLVVKLGKYGKFLSCSGFPECKYGRPFEDKDHDGQPGKVDKSQLKGKCPECGGELVLKEGRFGKFIACGNYPKCKFTKPYLDKIGMKCPECKKGEVIVKKTKRGRDFYGCSNYPKCKWASWKDPRKKSPKNKE